MNIQEMMRQAQRMQEQLQKKMEEAQKELASLELMGESGAGMVKITMNGRHDVRRVTLDPELLREDKDFIEDLLAAAINDAVRKVEAASQSHMSGLTAGMGLPPGMKLPF